MGFSDVKAGLLIVIIGLVVYVGTRRELSYTMKSLENEIMSSGKTRGERNNNPGNIRPAGYTWQGQVGQDCGSMGCYIKFSSPVMGIRALARDLLTKYRRGLNTVRKIISAYAPAADNNNVGAYANFVSRYLGVSPDTVINMENLETHTAFVYAVIHHENGRVIYDMPLIVEGVSFAR